jgi:hypothetical protein
VFALQEGDPFDLQEVEAAVEAVRTSRGGVPLPRHPRPGGPDDRRKARRAGAAQPRRDHGRARPPGDEGFGRRTRDTHDRRRFLVEVTPEVRRGAVERYGALDEGTEALASYTDEQLEFLIGFLRGSVAYQEERMRRLDELKARRATGE